MEALWMAVLMAIGAASNVACFVIGAKVGQKVARGEDIKMPVVSPAQAHRAREEKKAQQMEQERLEVILRNIEGYDGTGLGQEDIPERR